MKTQQTTLTRSVKTLSASGLLLALGISTSAVAAEVTCAAATNINADSAVNCFTPNTPAKSAEVNANFERLLARIAVLEAKLAAVSYDDNTKKLLIEGANVQIVNGLDNTGAKNGKGNLIIGYNRAATREVCSNSTLGVQDFCTGIWGVNQRSGSHNVIIGDKHQYTQVGGLVAGYDNAILGAWATATGGTDHSVGAFSSVSGGAGNTASGIFSSVSGGRYNEASGSYSSVSGGGGNTSSTGNRAAGEYASVSGGSNNIAGPVAIPDRINDDENGHYTTVSGGRNNHASGDYATVSGGGGDQYLNDANRARGKYSTVSGGKDNEETTLWGHRP